MTYPGAECTSFAHLSDWLKHLPDQVVGNPSAVCETGEEYHEFSESALVRPGDEKTVENWVARHMFLQLKEYLSGRKGRIYWRIPFESEINDHQTVIRYDENGPDTDLITDRKCVLDKNWKLVSCYCRVYRASLQVTVRHPQAYRPAA